MAFETHFLVRFAHVDPAGIVFYPRYFEMLSAATEDWFARSLGLDYREMHLEWKCGVPSVHMETVFFAPSRLGDELVLRVRPLRVGNSSCLVEVLFLCGDELRVRFEMTLVWTHFERMEAMPWPDEVKTAIKRQIDSK